MFYDSLAIWLLEVGGQVESCLELAESRGYDTSR